MKPFCLSILFCLVIWSSTGQAAFAQQTDSTQSSAQEDLERVFDDFDPDDAEFNTEQLTQFLQDLAANPININKTSSDKLLIIPGLNIRLAQAIVQYRDSVKLFEQIDEIKEVRGIGNATLERIRPYITLGKPGELQRQLITDFSYWTFDGEVEYLSRYQRTLQEQEGFRRPDSTGFVGSPGKVYQRFRYRSDHLSLAVTQEKDSGEELTSPAGFDYNSFHLSMNDVGKLQQLVIGDYSLSAGQGMVLWNGGAFGKGRDVIGTANRNERGIRPYSSAQETDFYRGVAATYGNTLQVSGYFSKRNKSASVISGDTVRSPSSSGFHRTVNELSRKNNLEETFYGGRVRYQLPFGVLGATGYGVSYDRFIGQGNRLSSQFDFQGTSTSVFGADYRLFFNDVLLYGEAGRSQNGGWGVVSGLEYALTDNIELALAYRNYQRDFQSIFGDGFGEVSGEPQNEKGIYAGLDYDVNEWLTLSAYFDQYEFDAPRFGLNQASDGHDWLGLADFQFSNIMSFYILARSEIKGDEFDVQDRFGRTVVRLGNEKRNSYRGQLQYWVNPRIRLRSRVEFVENRQAGGQNETGFLLFQDVRLVPTPKWKIDARITFFDTDSFNSRVFQFENNLLYVLSNTALSGQGQRSYILLNYEPLDYLEVWARYSISIFENRRTVSSGRTKIQGNTRSDIGVEVRVKF